MHHVSLKGILHKAITDVKLIKEEVKAIDPTALNYYSYTSNEDDEQATAMTDKDKDAFQTDDSKLVPIPFELYKINAKWLFLSCN